MRIRTYSDLNRLGTFEERYRYLALGGQVGQSTFGFERYVNQNFYRSREWRHLRHDIIVRDNGCDLGVEGHDIFDRIIVHHMNPMVAEDIIRAEDDILNPEFLICVTHDTHNAIHYGDENLLRKEFVERRPGDTLLWRRK